MLRTGLPIVPRFVACRALSSPSVRISRAAFSLSPYSDVYDLGYGRGTQFCMLTLRHPKTSESSDEECLAIFAVKAASETQRVEELFKFYDKDASGSLDRAQLAEAMVGIGLPPEDDIVASVLRRLDANHDGMLQREEFAALLKETWGSPLHLSFTDKLCTAISRELDGRRGVSWVGRTVPTHYVLRALRNSWPTPVESVSILRNTKDNADLDPGLMEVFDSTFMPSVPEEVGTATRLALAAAEQPPTAAGGFVVGVREVSGEVEYVPLLGLCENSSTGGLDAKPGVMEWMARMWPIPVTAGGVIAFAMLGGK